MIEQFASELRAILSADDGVPGRQQARAVVARYCLNSLFTDTYLKVRRTGEPVREVLYEDEALGFCICGHVYREGQDAPPHDHGSSWAIYGQVSGQTIMTDWEVIDEGSETQPKLVKPLETYTLDPGDTHLYDIGAVHSLVRRTPVRTIRIEGSNLDHIKRSEIKPITS